MGDLQLPNFCGVPVPVRTKKTIVDDSNLASPYIHYATILPRVLVYEDMQDLHLLKTQSCNPESATRKLCILRMRC